MTLFSLPITLTELTAGIVSYIKPSTTNFSNAAEFIHGFKNITNTIKHILFIFFVF